MAICPFRGEDESHHVRVVKPDTGFGGSKKFVCDTCKAGWYGTGKQPPGSLETAKKLYDAREWVREADGKWSEYQPESARRAETIKATERA